MLNWSDEGVRSDGTVSKWSQTGSNVILDFHGDPRAADLVVYSDGNHHMALEQTLQLFKDTFPEIADVFYATTPPMPILELVRKGRLKIGNFVLSATPHLFLSPPHVLDSLVADGHMAAHRPFMKNRGNVLLVRKGNPKQIVCAGDLAREDVRLFLPNPVTETVSYRGYVGTIKAMALKEGFNASFLAATASNRKVFFGQNIHHREAPEAVAASIVDAGVVYYHLALRYVRIFPEIFDMVPLGGTVDAPDPHPENLIGFTHAGLIGDGGRWGKICLDFLFTRQVADVYAAHGLDAMFQPDS
jgi:hypothetical protein